jgi:DNA-binding NarL/FixJ family response regulator
MEKIKIMIADDQRLMREGLCTILELEKDFRVVGLAADGLEAMELSRAETPDIILMDIRMPTMDGVEATGRILAENPAVNIIILTTFDDDDLIISALKAGARTYLLKDLPSEKLVETIRAIYRGDILMQPTIAAKLVQRAVGTDDGHKSGLTLAEELTKREKTILSLMTEGCSNSEIAARLFLSEGTVKNHISAIYAKLGINDRAQTVLFALKHKLT